MNLVPIFILLVGAFYSVIALSPLAGLVPRQFIYHSPCSVTRTYRIGSIDNGFNLPNDLVLEYLSQAAKVWNTASGRKLLSFDENGEITVSLRYDIRQKLGSQARELEDYLAGKKTEIEAKEGEYAKRISDFETRLAAYQTEVTQINVRGGATPEEYERLSAELSYLESEAFAINQEIAAFNSITRDYNADVNQYGATVDYFNREIVMKPEEGIFDPNDNSITLYLYTTKEELIHTMAHEFGHALGIDHVSDPTAVMYLYSNSRIDLTSSDREALAGVCSERKYLNVLADQLRLGWQVLLAALPEIRSRLIQNFPALSSP